ncbi:cold-shock protein [Vreelandella olivaria]|uniref:cold-shock protein n=1 Tax=Vreelandella olivaria TaxID=390919 RepID=UPI0024C275F0|nr:cold shock domain-containing protein [Halomonas olivaria]
MNPKVVFRCFFISVLLAAPTPLLLAGIVHLTNAPLAEQWLAELAINGGGGVYIAVALGCFIMLCIGTLAAAALAPPLVVKADVTRVKPAPRQPKAAPAVEDEEEDIIDPNDGREEGEVKWFNTNKGYGFITRDNGEDVFVHFRAIRGRGPRMLAEGQIVRYHVIKNDRGLQADDVSIIE